MSDAAPEVCRVCYRYGTREELSGPSLSAFPAPADAQTSVRQVMCLDCRQREIAELRRLARELSGQCVRGRARWIVKSVGVKA